MIGNKYAKFALKIKKLYNPVTIPNYQQNYGNQRSFEKVKD